MIERSTSPLRPTPERIELVSVPWPEVAAGDDLAGLVCDHADLRDGDVVVLTSKVVSKAEGRAEPVDRSVLVERDTERVVARRGGTVIARTRHGFVLAGAGVDASNVAPGSALSLPEDPDASARHLRAEVLDRRAVNVAVVISDTAGRAWRVGQTDVAIGCAGLAPSHDLAGTEDPYGNELAVTQMAVADEIAAAADLVKGKTSGRPLAVLRGFAAAVLAAGEHGPGAASLIRDTATDMFGLGARDAVIAAARRDPAARAGLPALSPADRAPFEGVAAGGSGVRLVVREHATEDGRPSAWSTRLDVREEADEHAWTELGRLSERIETLAWAHGLRSGPQTPSVTSDTGWRTVSGSHWIVA